MTERSNTASGTAARVAHPTDNGQARGVRVDLDARAPVGSPQQRRHQVLGEVMTEACTGRAGRLAERPEFQRPRRQGRTHDRQVEDPPGGHAQLAATAPVGRTMRAKGPEPTIAVRGYGEGCLAVALGGSYGPRAADRLGVVLDELRRVATTELLIALGGVHDSERHLGRVLGATRIRCLIAGTVVELHDVPTHLYSEIDPGRGVGA